MCAWRYCFVFSWVSEHVCMAYSIADLTKVDNDAVPRRASGRVKARRLLSRQCQDMRVYQRKPPPGGSNSTM
ncbi:hypothetical protein AUEXF2481DRAFT_253086 [Aureobasidium subglaciale EXF-2481]|uniref:Secreted protein n=1 Tax=Aureobasidium subglaciale (strain EXF-2481) TaxID=1043005 RepID=A0A074Z738_AURSE|nr:uncharacterized protein AUEXF2481DRAFT_253086 [Aureobasidium subglaciale EXF-2481]KEQ94691.1 hypothetical protein AUEXF2481DRAFT_253086 [Aureobasidium subglaciale EXF-2481]